MEKELSFPISVPTPTFLSGSDDVENTFYFHIFNGPIYKLTLRKEIIIYFRENHLLPFVSFSSSYFPFYIIFNLLFTPLNIYNRLRIFGAFLIAVHSHYPIVLMYIGKHAYAHHYFFELL